MSFRKQWKTWDSKGPEAQRLIRLFTEFELGRGGADPNLTKPATINELIRDNYDIFQQYKPEQFPKNYRKLATNYNLNKEKSQSKKGKFYCNDYDFYCYLYK